MEIKNWRPLHKNIIAVAVERLDGWCAYIGPVPGVRHLEEYPMVSETGTKLPVEIASVIFPEMEGTYAK